MVMQTISRVVRWGSILVLLAYVCYLKFDDSRLQKDLMSVNHQLGAASEREAQLVNVNAAMNKTVKQLREAARQARLASEQVALQKLHWQHIAQKAQAQIDKDIAHANCTHRLIPGATGWMYYTNQNRTRHSVSN